MKNNLSKIKRLKLANLPTPLEKLDRLGELLNVPDLYMKRDDLTGHFFGGNKERKLEFILAAALAQQATVVVTVGVRQSNHCRLTAALANKLGLKTELILINKETDNQAEAEGNFYLDKLLQATIHQVRSTEVQAKIDQVMADLKAAGEQAYFIEGGGHSVLGVMGYAQACAELNLAPDYVVLPVGTGTTHAGLLLGKRIFNLDFKIIGVSVSRQQERCVQEIKKLFDQGCELLGLDCEDEPPAIQVYDQYVGPGYGQCSTAGLAACQQLAQLEGVALDPIYNGKAMAGLIDLSNKSIISGKIIYLNTGGLPVLFNKNIKQALGGNHE